LRFDQPVFVPRDIPDEDREKLRQKLRAVMNTFNEDG